MKELIEFNWEKYQSGDYEAVYRGCHEKITRIEPYNNPIRGSFHKYKVHDDEGDMVYISSTGRAFEGYTSDIDVLLRKK